MFCENCGAENSSTATLCVFCHQLLQVPPAPALDLSKHTDTSTILAPNTLLNERYRIVSCVGQGGFGSVYQAQDTDDHDRVVAIKMLNLSGLGAQQVIEATSSFNSEVAVLSELQHASLPRLYDHFSDAQHWYMVMDFFEGQTLECYLEQLVQQQPYPTKPATIRQLLKMCLEVCNVLDYMHSQTSPVIFRDLKPANIMLGLHNRVCLIDFGIARHFKRGQTKDTIPLGSPGYAAPEQYGKAQSTPRSDIYGLGAIMHQMFTGKDPSESPFHFCSVHSVNPAVPVELDHLIVNMVEMEAEKRPQTVLQVKNRLNQVIQKMTSSSYSAGHQAQSQSQQKQQHSHHKYKSVQQKTSTPSHGQQSAAASSGQVMQSIQILPMSAQQQAEWKNLARLDYFKHRSVRLSIVIILTLLFGPLITIGFAVIAYPSLLSDPLTRAETIIFGFVLLIIDMFFYAHVMSYIENMYEQSKSMWLKCYGLEVHAKIVHINSAPINNGAIIKLCWKDIHTGNYFRFESEDPHQRCQKGQKHYWKGQTRYRIGGNVPVVFDPHHTWLYEILW